MLKFERISLIVSVESVNIHTGNNESSWQFSGKQAFLAKVEITAGYVERFTDDTSDGILGVSAFHGFCMCQKRRIKSFIETACNLEF